MKVISTTSGDAILVDDDDFPRLSNRAWHVDHGGYARNLKKISNSRIKTKTVYMHREIMNPSNGQVVDHINGNKLDNRKSNLRLCTIGENTSYSKTLEKPSRKINGINRNADGSWEVSIPIGKFSDLDEAISAYADALVKIRSRRNTGN